MTSVETFLDSALEIAGVTGAAVVDFQQRRVLGARDLGRGPDMDKVAFGDSDVMRAKLYTLELLGYRPESVEDMLITLEREVHLIRPLLRLREGGIFVYFVVDRERALPLDDLRSRIRALEPLLEL
ncbi:hypothetical protein H9Y04_24965 [Streptomyces sp. TRM66268-LWL]|uniref:Roadblock/LC7 domain-containing protein n=1 Tax=Streptomyces polyasparticus TaxID=2767826 RepID=A0ABR7SNA3_9ACTN|nr:hypothetical protein [Streptomyces polyasparticus]MBC9715798.1 hypothetical protein [Streptomyces polyasparticus]